MQSIFIVDDDSDDILFVKSAFEKFGNTIRLQSFANGKELLNQLNSPDEHPVFILLDLNMPIMAGIETLRVIRNTQALAHLNVIVFSTSNSPKERQASLDAGASEYICKPFSLEAYEKIAEHLFTRWGIPVPEAD
jgi:CheY-like chemotaxis protein